MPVSPDDEVRLVDDDDNEVAPGEVGEFLARTHTYGNDVLHTILRP